MTLKQPFRFGLVGGTATLIHIMVGMACIWMGIPPILANFLAFVAALSVSFCGHYAYSFRGHPRSIRYALTRFLLIAISAFSLNELLLVMFLNMTAASPAKSLLMSTTIVTAFTFVLSKNWAFQAKTPAPMITSCL